MTTGEDPYLLLLRDRFHLVNPISARAVGMKLPIAPGQPLTHQHRLSELVTGIDFSNEPPIAIAVRHHQIDLAPGLVDELL
jgi:hypothetical protein